ncbi:glutamate--tRNA ligase [Candidatus Pacearchaeota archaeon]|nr:glutamate--tRNA ligase [Candidatus Pacearchaeota archaeon]
MKDLKKEIRAYALKNALEFGKAEAGRILPKMFQHGLEKGEIKEAMPVISEIVKEVNTYSNEQKEKEYETLKELVKEREEEKKKDLPDLPNLEGGVVTRIPPEPSKYLHIGHALSFLLNYLSARQYGGKCLLRFEDANPEKVSQEFVDAMLEDMQGYLEIKPDGIRYVSDDMDLMYQNAEELIGLGKSYACFCDRKSMQEMRHEGKECDCRKANVKETLEEWKKMLAGKYKEGEAVLRLKGDMKALNHVMRDPVLFRVVETKHFRKGTQYKVWPMYDFYNPLEDNLMGVTHILRSNEFDQRVELQDLLKDLLGLRKQTIIQYGRFGVLEGTTKGREIRDLVESGEYIGWDDPRLVTLKALRRRGIKKEVIYELVKQLGLSKYEIKIDFAMIAALSRKMIDAETARYYFVPDPVEIHVKGSPILEHVHIPLHPGKSETRTIDVGDTVYISSDDIVQLKGKEARLLHLYNVQLPKSAKKGDATFTSLENKQVPKIQWVSHGVPVRVFMPDGSWKEGIGESGLVDLKEGDVVQFERFGFVKLDAKKEGKLEFWFTHH